MKKLSLSITGLGLAGILFASVSHGESSTDEVLCEARGTTLVANTSNIILNSGTLVDSYDSAAGDYGAPNVGDDALVLAGTNVLNNGAIVEGSVLEYAPAGFPVVAPPADAINLPLGSSSPGWLNVNGSWDSIELEPGDYVVQGMNINGSGAIDIDGDGEVRIWVLSSLNLGGYVNAEGTPDQMAFILPNSGWVNMNGGELHGLLYAPKANVNVNGTVFGSVVAQASTLNSGASVHYDISSACDAE